MALYLSKLHVCSDFIHEVNQTEDVRMQYFDVLLFLFETHRCFLRNF